MKNFILSLMIITGVFSSAQVTIEKTEAGGTPANGFVSVEFGNKSGGVKGVVLPWVTSEAGVTAAVPGTLIFDSATQKVKLATAASAEAATATGWLDLTMSAAVPSPKFTNNAALQENDQAKVIIGAPSSAAPGILVLETPKPATEPKAMILPRVNAYTDIVNPAAGMMVYIISTSTFAVYNGKEWTFWKASN